MAENIAKKKGIHIIGILGIIGIVALYFILNHFFDLHMLFEMEKIKSIISSAGIFGPLVFIGLMALAIIFSPLPSLPLDAAGGIIWGAPLATVYAVIGAEIGAIIAFLIARYLGRDVIENFFKHHIEICYQCSEKYLFWIVLLSRLFPFFQFDIISYGAGLTNMKLRNFAIATGIGMIPMTYVFAKFGESFVSGNVVIISIASVLVIVGMFVLPVLINKHNFFGLREKIIIKKKK